MSHENIKNRGKCPTKHFLSVTLKCDKKLVKMDATLGTVSLMPIFRQNINYTNIDLEIED